MFEFVMAELEQVEGTMQGRSGYCEEGHERWLPIYVYTVYSPLSDHPYNHRFPLGDCLSGRRTKDVIVNSFCVIFPSYNGRYPQVTVTAGNRAQSLKRLYSVQPFK
jgi:hypothetical protein